MVKSLRQYILPGTLVAETRPSPHSIREGYCPDAGNVSVRQPFCNAEAKEPKY